MKSETQNRIKGISTFIFTALFASSSFAGAYTSITNKAEMSKEIGICETIIVIAKSNSRNEASAEMLTQGMTAPEARLVGLQIINNQNVKLAKDKSTNSCQILPKI